MVAPLAQLPVPPTVLAQLARTSAAREVGDLADRLMSLERWVRADLVGFEAELETLGRGARVVQQAAHHLLDLKGKRLRPMCVVLASRLGEGFSPAARALAMAVELVHAATLLHDDVVDVADLRRGKPAARMIYGNAASIFAGDWLLVSALQRVAGSGVTDVLPRMLGVIEEMILAESLQLERRGRIVAERAEYFRIIEGKTAALFRWAMFAGARAGGVGPAAEAVLERYGLHLGVAFQAVDDGLDFLGDAAALGKDPLADLREGKVTYPLVVALERAPALAARLEAALAEDAPRIAELTAIAAAVRATGAIDATRQLAEEHAGKAIAQLDALPAGPARDALATVALASLGRTR